MQAPRTIENSLVALHARYRQLVHTQNNILSLFDLGQLKALGQIAMQLPQTEYTICYPFSFADLHLEHYPNLESIFSKLDFATQCRVLDVGQEYAQEGTCLALIAVDHENGCQLLLSLAKQQKKLEQRALENLQDPLLTTLIDSEQEPQLADLIDRSYHVLTTMQQRSKQCSIYVVPCSEEFFVTYVFHQLIDVPYALKWEKDDQLKGFLRPCYLSEESSW